MTYIDKYVCAIIKNESKYLLFFHNKLNGFTAPGGKVESGETEKSALIRELREEVNIKVTNRDLVKLTNLDGIDYHINKNNNFILAVYFLKWNEKNGIPINLEPNKHSNLNWYTIDEIKQFQNKRYTVDFILKFNDVLI